MKLDEFNRLYSGRDSFIVHVNTKAPGVAVPFTYLVRKNEIGLQIGRKLPVAIPDLYVGNFEFSCTLSFGGNSFHCVIPWDAVYALVDHTEGYSTVWEEAMHEETRRVYRDRMEKQVLECRKPKLYLVK